MRAGKNNPVAAHHGQETIFPMKSWEKYSSAQIGARLAQRWTLALEKLHPRYSSHTSSPSYPVAFTDTQPHSPPGGGSASGVTTTPPAHLAEQRAHS
jgi:hypothetical protein